jgi:hypothetical protein
MTRRARTVTLLGLVAILAAVPAAPAQTRPVQRRERSEFLEGTHAFRRILYDAARKGNLTPLSREDALTEPRRTLIVVLGDPDPLRAVEQRTGATLLAFVQNGGALLVATDQRTAHTLEPNFGVSVTGDILTLAQPDDETAFRGMKECPYVQPEWNTRSNLFEPAPPAFRGERPKPVASNLPSRLSRSGRPARGLPALAHLPGPFQGQAGPAEFAAGGEGRAGGRVLIMADHSVFINEMLLQPDNGNIDFAYRCADWLLTGPDGRRDRILFYEDGAVRIDFDIPLKSLPPPPLPPPDTLLGMLDETVHAMEEEGTFARLEEDDFFNGTVEDLMRSAPFWERTAPEWKLWTLLVVAASAVLGLYAFVRLGTFRHRPDATGPALGALLRRQAPAGAVMEQRHDALLRDGNVWEAARELARHLLASAGASLDAGSLLPALAVRGGWWRRWRVRRLWARLWQLARSARPVRVSPRRFARLTVEVEFLRTALADGTVRIIH